MSGDRSSTYAHPFQLRGGAGRAYGFKTRTYRTEEAMRKAAEKWLAKHAADGDRFLSLEGRRDFHPQGWLARDSRLIAVYYPPALQVWGDDAGKPVVPGTTY
jgi:hypothetical protein